jgi:hypothetical protein
MTPQEAEILVRQEVASGSPLGKALLLLLAEAELQNYRQSAKTVDPYTTVRICGRGEGINSIINRITPVQDAAQPGRPVPSAVGAPQ